MKYQDLSIFLLPSGLHGASALKVQAWWLIQSTLFALSPQFMCMWRDISLRLFGAKMVKELLFFRESDSSTLGNSLQVTILGLGIT